MRLFTFLCARTLGAVALAAAPLLTPLAAQSASSTVAASAPSKADTADEIRERPPAFAAGVSAGSMRFSTGRSQVGAAATLEYSPNSWLTLSASPGVGRTTFAGTSSNGLTDIPLSVGVGHDLGDLPLSPSLYGSLYTTLSPGDSTSALGLGRSTFGGSVALTGWLTDLPNVTIAGSRPLSSNAGNGSIDLESAYSIGKTTPSLGVSSEVGRADSGATLARSIAAGLAFAIAGPLTLTVDGSRGLTTGAPAWTFSVGFGTAFAGISPLDPTSPLRRLSKVLGGRARSTSGYTKSGKGGRNCRKAGTC